MIVSLCCRYPLFARFIVGAAFHLASPNNLLYEYVPAHLEAGILAERFRPMSVELGIDLIGGFALAAIARLAAAEAPDDYPEQVATALLLALGMAQQEAERIACVPIELLELPEDSLVARATARSAGSASLAGSP